MSSDQLPIVDDNAKASAESVLAVRGLFSNKNGFISREEFPDYGCDLDVEMIMGGEGASSKKFPIQIKSSSILKTISVENVEYFSKPFSTSRLNYLCQRPPAYGLIVLYDEPSQTCYYEFAEEVVRRLIAGRKSQDWRAQETVSIHIPLDNRLTMETVALIHAKIKARFEAHDILIRQHGAAFDIPSFSFLKIDDTVEQSPIEILKKYGLLFMNQADFFFLYQLLSNTSIHEIFGSKDLIFVAAVTYGEMGKCIEAEMYLSKAFQSIDQFEVHEQEILRFIRIKVDFLLGKRNKADYFEDLKSMNAVTKNKFNALQISINILYYTLIQKIESKELDDALESDILELFQVIDVADVDEEKKMFLNVFHAENLLMYISSKIFQEASNIKLKDALKIYVSQNERFQLRVRTNELIKLATVQVLNARNFSLKKQNKALQAFAEYALARFYMTREFDFLALRLKEEIQTKEADFKRFFLLAINSHNIFLEIGLLKDARLSLICAYDLSRLARLWYEIDISTPTTTEKILKNNLAAAQMEMGITTEYISIVDKAFDDYQNELVKEKENAGFRDLSDDNISKSAQIILRAYGLPAERLVNIVNEMKSLRYFSTYCNTTDFEVLTDLRHYNSKETLFASPSKFIIRSKKTGIESLSSTDLENLAGDFGALR